MKSATLFRQKTGLPENSAKTKPFFQAKLTVNQPGDSYEQEADTVADRVMRMSDATQPVASFSKVSVADLQRKCAACEEEQVQRKENGGGSLVAPASVSNVISGRGQPLDSPTRQFMESRMGQDFGDVQIHTDGQAAASAQSINALAYTSGKHIVFNSGRYQPNTDSGKRLLAHELVHVGQQGEDTLKRYRAKSDINFGEEDTVDLIEDSFDKSKKSKDKENKPWIETITIEFTGTKKDVNGDEYWEGSATAKYYENSVKLPEITVKVAGGSKGLGMTDKTPKKGLKVTRIEGVGYNSGKHSGKFDPKERETANKKYSIDKRGNMNYAIFYNGGEAVHAGPEDESSHGCVHVAWSNTELIKQMNYHSVKGLTRVIVKY